MVFLKKIITSVSLCHSEMRLEGWLSLPVRNNTKKFGWEKKVKTMKPL